MLLTTIAPPEFPAQVDFFAQSYVSLPNFPRYQQRFPRNPYRNTAYEGYQMCYSENDKIHGFLITQHIGRIYAGFDSPPRTNDQPISAEVTAAIKEQVIARLQAKAKSIGASAMVEVSVTIRESSVAASERILHGEGQAMACFCRPS